ncbi:MULTISPECIES: phosphate ABC transporter substrate-binding protein PstS [Nocardiopsis]|uniref:Phosphate-binding protein n=1 Tax=Nocardiopsis sinuspersici TaxID=501010 RepID=A0A1V3BZS2_9ACTN|nr:MULTISPECIES: phosphate ABC transporter substrate-binding protein PstS [Nocardiopsis]NYH55013.1 phosphate transport system substrate-binding protein [Nocardiopsis sinuspersici]OOC53736.1 phosphate ABC transporter substrate-binding protein PstS [Nocardiopsis sinuspersici]
MLPSNKRTKTGAPRHRGARRGAASAALAGLLLAVTACGSDQAVPESAAPAVPEDLECFSGSLSGAGSSAQENAMTTWIAGYQSACEESRVYYNSIGSGGGRSQFIDGAVAFAGTDAALDPAENADAQERCGGSDTLNLPAYVVPIAVVFNLEGVDSLNLRPETLAKIFNQEITRWDHPEIAEANPDVDLPDKAITPVNRSDDSGTTENFTNYLHQAAPKAWPHEPGGQWPITAYESAQGNSGIADTVKRAKGAIGYVEMSHAHGMSTVDLGVGGEFVEISPEAAAKVVAKSPQREENPSEYDLALNLDYGTTESGTYPLVLVSYEVVCLDYPDDQTAQRVKAFMKYVVSPEGQQAVSEETGSAPISDDLRGKLLESINAIS